MLLFFILAAVAAGIFGTAPDIVAVLAIDPLSAFAVANIVGSTIGGVQAGKEAERARAQQRSFALAGLEELESGDIGTTLFGSPDEPGRGPGLMALAAPRPRLERPSIHQ